MNDTQLYLLNMYFYYHHQHRRGNETQRQQKRAAVKRKGENGIKETAGRMAQRAATLPPRERERERERERIFSYSFLIQARISVEMQWVYSTENWIESRDRKWRNLRPTYTIL